jgi:KaiC/GvpD/RAD55 family RecA-like ATPase
MSPADSNPVLGLPEVDESLARALPVGFLAVLTGGTAGGAPILARQFAAAAVGNAPVRYYTTYERSEDLRQAFLDSGTDPEALTIVNLADEYYERVLVRGLDVARVRERGLSIEELTAPAKESRAPGPFRLSDRMLADLAAIDAPFRLVIDSLDFFFEVLGPKEVMQVAREVRHCCRTVGGQALLAVHGPRAESTAGGPLTDLADLVLGLRSEPNGDRFHHTLFVEKVGHRPDLARLFPLSLGESGWTVEPAAERGARGRSSR